MGVDTSAGMQLVAQATGQSSALRALVCVACGHTTLYAKAPERFAPRTAAPAVAEVRSGEAAEAEALAQRAEEPEAGRQDWLAAEEEAVVQVPGSAMPTTKEGHQQRARRNVFAPRGSDISARPRGRPSWWRRLLGDQ